MVGFTRPPCDAGIIRATPAFPAALSDKRKRLTLVATILGSSMALIDGSVVNIALPAIQQALHADAASTQWIVNAYLLLLGALVLVGSFFWASRYSPWPRLPAGLRRTSRCWWRAARSRVLAQPC
jgi:MFS family permease